MRSWCWEDSELSVRASRLSESSASPRRRSRACCRAVRDSETRATQSLSGAMLKLVMVWRMSWGGRRLVGQGGVGCGGEAAYGGGVFFEEHFGGLRGLEGVVLAVWIVGCSCWLRMWAWGCWS